MDTDQLRSRIHDDMPRVIDELSRLVAIPSIGYEGYDPANVRASAELTRDILRDAGVGADLLEIEGGHPAVYGTVPGPADRPTGLLYAQIQANGQSIPPKRSESRHSVLIASF